MTIKRHYDNSKREAKAEATRQKIIDALIQQLIENNTQQTSIGTQQGTPSPSSPQDATEESCAPAACHKAKN